MMKRSLSHRTACVIVRSLSLVSLGCVTMDAMAQSSSWVFTTLAGTAGSTGSSDGTGGSARFNNPLGLAVDGGGNIFIADTDNHTIRKVTPGGVVTTFAGSPGAPGNINGPAASARFRQPTGVAVDTTGNVYVSEYGNDTIRKITAAGVVTTLASGVDRPYGLAVDTGGNVYVARYFSHSIHKVSPAGVVTTYAGAINVPGDADGAATAVARFRSPHDLALDESGNLFVADSDNNTVRKITSAGVVTTIAGLARAAGSADGTGAAARFNNPGAVGVDSSGNLFVADTGNRTIRKITSAGVVTTVAGLAGSAAANGDGGGSAARFGTLYFLRMGGAEVIYATDYAYNTVRRGVLTPDIAPTITTQPASLTVNASQAATFTVVATGSPPPTFQWKKDGGTISGATTATYAISNAQTSHVGSYTVDVTNVVSTVTSTAAVLTVNTLPVITTQPAAQAGSAGSTAIFTVVATGIPVPTYQWRKNAVNITGATTATLTLSNVQAIDAGSYTVVVTNSVGSVTSSAATLTLTNGPVITTQPVSRTAIPGASVAFSVVATASPAPTYQWRKDTIDIPGATSANLLLTNVQTTNNGSYSVVVNNSIGPAVTSNTATLTVQSLPVIVTQPASQIVNVGAAASFTVVATGVPAPTYQWRKNAANINGETGPTLAIGSVQAIDVGTYTVAITNSAGTVISAAATLTLNAPPAITTQPTAKSALPGGNVTFSVVASGNPAPNFQWSKDGTALPGATSATLALTNVQSGNEGSYSVVVNNSVGPAVTSNAVTLTVHTLPVISTQPAAQTVAAGTTVTFSVVATGHPDPTYQWRKGTANINGATNTTLTLGNVTATGAGSYNVVVANSAGSVTSTSAALTVNSPPVITTQPVARSATFGTNATFTVVATGSPPPTYQWQKDGAAIAGATAASYLVTNVQVASEGTYAVVVTNSVGTVTSNAVALTATAAVIAPAIVSHPASTAATVGDSAAFTVAATGTSPAYQWLKNFATLPGATAATLTLSSVQASDEGSYSVIVSNSAGTVTSALAQLTVNVPPAILTQPAGRSLVIGGYYILGVVASGNDPLSYQWQKDGAALPGATTAVLTLENVDASSAGSYAIVVTNPFGTVTSNGAVITIITPPVITAQPTDQNVAPGAAAVFTVTASGTGPLSYQWRKDGASVSGATSSTFALSAAQSTDTGEYTVAVSNAAGSALSAAATLTVSATPTITGQPASLSVTTGSPAALTVTAIGSAPLSYQWQRNGSPLTGRTGATLALVNVQAGDAGEYRVVVTNSVGSVTSAAATLGVTSTALPPTIVSQPESQARGVGSIVTFRVEVSGTSPFSYQWRRNGTAIPEKTGDTLILPFVSQADAASYTVVVSNGQGSVTSSVATLVIVSAPTITTPPADVSVEFGATTSFTVVASGLPPLTYQWFKDGSPIAGATNPTLPRLAVTEADAGTYWVTVVNAAGPVTSRTATLEVRGAASRLSNLSVRTTAGAGSQTLIVGFVVAGPGGKTVLVRGIGPSLATFGVGGALADPQLTLFRGTTQIATNDNWGDPPTGTQVGEVSRQLGAFALTPNSRDSALLATLQPESYTAQLVARGVGGIALVELYDGDSVSSSRVINVSTRCQVGTGANILIVGFFISGNAPKSVLLRGVGPTLAAFGVTDALANPQMTLLRGTQVVGTNDDWYLAGGATGLPPVFAAVGAFPLTTNSRDAALVVTLQPGSYTVQISGVGGTSGVALAEIYEAP